MASPKPADLTIPSEMTRAAARFFASDWESSSFLEFFVDLQLRVADDVQAGIGRTLGRLRDHARFALQVALLRSVDSFLAYLGEIESTVVDHRNVDLFDELLGLEGRRHRGVPIDAGDRLWPALTHGNSRQLDRLFMEATDVPLFDDQEGVAIFTRLISIRNLVAHGRTFASDELATLVDETVSVGGLGLRLQDVRADLDYLRASVSRIDGEIAERWHLSRPVTRDALFAAIAAASKLGEADAETLTEKWLCG